MKKAYFLLLIPFSFMGCNDVEDSTPTKRTTFIHFYEKSTNYQGVCAEVVTDGFVIIANSIEADGLNSTAVITKTDLFGKTLWEKSVMNASASSIKVLTDGYLIFGDSIEVNPAAEQVTDIIKTKARLIKMDIDGNVSKDVSFKDATNPKVDFHGNAITTDATGNIVASGTFKIPGAPTRAFISSIRASTLDTIWFQGYGLLDRNYANAKSIHVTSSGKIVWASSAVKEQSSITLSYLTVPFVTPNSTFVNNGFFGENAGLFYSGADIQPSSGGFGIIGTYANIQGQKANIYFIRTDPSGNVIAGSEKYFDGVLSVNNTVLANIDDSQSEDSGDAIAITSDGGYVLGGSMTTTTERGNGGKDIFLIRLDPFGNILWNKNIGGAGDETVSAIRVAPDGGLVICGSSSINGLSSAYIMKTDKNGDIKE